MCVCLSIILISKACSCHPLGSTETTCNQATGQCNCRTGVVGRQCSMCPDGSQVTENGCSVKGQSEGNKKLIIQTAVTREI